jgi:hypothetical protein
LGRERENVSRLVLAKELAIEPADGRIGGEKDRDLAANPNNGPGFREKA